MSTTTTTTTTMTGIGLPQEAEGVMEMSKEFAIPEEMHLGGLFLALRALTRTFDSVDYDTEGSRKDTDGDLVDYLGFTAVMNGHRTSIAIYRSVPAVLTVDVIPEVNHSCLACNTMWENVRGMIYRYIGHWENYLSGRGQRGGRGRGGVGRRQRDVETWEEGARFDGELSAHVIAELNKADVGVGVWERRK